MVTIRDMIKWLFNSMTKSSVKTKTQKGITYCGFLTKKDRLRIDRSFFSHLESVIS